MDAKNIGKFISTLRKENNMTQAVLAEKLNISNRTVSKWENGDGFPDITILPMVAKTLGVTVDELLAGKKSTEKIADIKVTEVENKDNLDNLFLIAYVISIFIGAFGAFLGGITELYCIWAFRWLFYNHWEIVFVAVSLFTNIASGLIFSVGVTRLGIAYSKEEIFKKVIKKGYILSLILAVFPLCFLYRLIDCFAPKTLIWATIIAFTGVILIIYLYIYKKYLYRKKR